MRKLLLALFLLLPMSLQGQTNGSDTVSAFVGAGTANPPYANCREGTWKTFILSRYLRAGGTGGLSGLLADSIPYSSTTITVVKVDTAIASTHGSYGPNGNSATRCVFIDGSQSTGDAWTAKGATNAFAWTNFTARLDTLLMVRGIRLYAMQSEGIGGPQGVNLRLTSCEDVIIDDVEFSEADDKQVAGSECQNISILRTVSRGWQTRSTGTNFVATDNVTFAYGAWLGDKKRNPRVCTGVLNAVSHHEFLNQLWYNWRGDTFQTCVNGDTHNQNINMIGSRYKSGPDTNGGKHGRVTSLEWEDITAESPSADGGYPKIWYKDVTHGGASVKVSFTSSSPSNVPNTVGFSIDSSGAGPKDSVAVATDTANIIQLYPPYDTLSSTAMVGLADSLGTALYIDCHGNRQFRGLKYPLREAVQAMEDSTTLQGTGALYPSDSLDVQPVCADSNDDLMTDDHITRYGAMEPDSITLSGLSGWEHMILGLSVPNYKFPNDTASWRDSTWVAIQRDCLADNWQILCTPFTASSGGSIVPILWGYKYLLFIFIAFGTPLSYALWAAKMSSLSKLRNRELVADRELYLADEGFFNELAQTKHRSNREGRPLRRRDRRGDT